MNTSGSKAMNRNQTTPPAGRDTIENLDVQSTIPPDHIASRPSNPLPRLSARSGNRLIIVDVDQIDWIEADDNYSKIWVGPNCLKRREPMYHLEDRLGHYGFTRISRSTIVNLGRVCELQRLPYGKYEAILADGRQLEVTRSYARRTRAALRF
jgi:two-component system, LytTR family, response regulator